MSRSAATVYDASAALLRQCYGKSMPPQDYKSLVAGKPNAPTIAKLAAVLDTLTDGTASQRAGAETVVKRHRHLLPPVAPQR